MIDTIVKVRKKTDPKFNEDKLLDDLDEHNVITRSNKFKPEVELRGQKMSGYEALCQLYPELEQQTKVAKGKIRDKKLKRKYSSKT